MSFQYRLADTQLNQWQQLARRFFPVLCQPRAEDSHKGSHGTLGVVGGCESMSGAIVLAGSAALKSGCGKVWLGFLQNTLPVPLLPQQPELMLATEQQLLARHDINGWVVGCGLGTSQEAFECVDTLLVRTSQQPLLLDADALNLLAVHPHWQASLFNRNEPAVITPHPLEAARLLGCTVADIQANRPAAAGQLATRFQAWVVLKGHHTLVSSPTGQLMQNPSGNPGLATAGSGDVLAGIIGSLMIQGLPTMQAVCGGVWLHGIAAELLAANHIGPVGLCASEIVDAVRWLRNRLIIS
ncbi:hydroxyethylthiazole kinase-like uncharacterized protein yjeF [Neisseria sp. HSC-16F19]|nr:NAD(P)H-hydrate dehydratase [Neisseria sp. HSC-16F19]MCP2039519.1 hydroxyethylthiazole kinase-like uncharacterized protein yjeF [Neisseria sp. HSC-16F19]